MFVFILLSFKFYAIFILLSFKFYTTFTYDSYYFITSFSSVNVKIIFIAQFGKQLEIWFLIFPPTVYFQSGFNFSFHFILFFWLLWKEPACGVEAWGRSLEVTSDFNDRIIKINETVTIYSPDRDRFDGCCNSVNAIE